MLFVHVEVFGYVVFDIFDDLVDQLHAPECLVEIAQVGVVSVHEKGVRVDSHRTRLGFGRAAATCLIEILQFLERLSLPH